jgi:conjugal transfer pilus assembly protein TraU
MVTLGSQLNIDINADMYGANVPKDGKGQTSTFRHAHIFINPLMGLMEIALDSKCLEPKGFDLAWSSELDPTWSNEEMARLITPDAYLFGNIGADLACASDCVATTAGLDQMSAMLYFCAGCTGTLYPLDGWASSVYGGVQMSSIYTQRVMAKMHRSLLVPSMAGPAAMCNTGMPQITMDKRQYKYSMIYPVPQASANENGIGAGGSVMGCCQPFGRSTLLWGAGRELPKIGEDFAYGIFRKRDCCQ